MRRWVSGLPETADYDYDEELSSRMLAKSSNTCWALTVTGY